MNAANAKLLIKAAQDAISAVGKHTISATVKEFNTCVAQAGFEPMTYGLLGRATRKAHLVEDLNMVIDRLKQVATERDRKAGHPVDEEGNDIREWSGNDIEAAHAEALEMNFDFDQLAATVETAHTEATLMNRYTDLLPIAQVTSVFAHNPVFKALRILGEIHQLTKIASLRHKPWQYSECVHAYAAWYRVEGLEMGFSFDYLAREFTAAQYKFHAAIRQLRAIRDEADQMNK